MRRLGALMLGGALIAGTALARPPRSTAPPPEPRAADAGSPALSPEDQEVVQNLELLEHLPESRELDTLLELSQVQSSEEEPPADAGSP